MHEQPFVYASEDLEDAPQRDRDAAQLLRIDPRAAVGALYERYAPLVNRWVWRLMGPDPDHHDIVQHVFMTVLRDGRRLRDVDRLGAWIRMITVNAVYDELRKRDVRRLFLREQRETRAHANLVRDVEARELMATTKALLEKLPAKELIVFMLYFFEQQNLTQIAALLGYSRATAKRRLYDAAARVQRLGRGSPELLRLLALPTERP